MTKEQAFAWMDGQIEAYEKTRECLDDISCIERPSYKEIHIHGLEKLASVTGLEYDVVPFDGYDDKHDPDAEERIMYHGYKFYQLKWNVYHEANVRNS